MAVSRKIMRAGGGLAARERLGVSGRRLHAADAHEPAEELVVEPVLAVLVVEQSRSRRSFSSTIGSSSGTKTFGAPRSPSYFGISYSRIRWSRNVFQVSSHARRYPAVFTRVREDEIGPHVLEALEDLLHLHFAHGWKPSRSSRDSTSEALAPARNDAALDLASSARAPGAASTTT